MIGLGCGGDLYNYGGTFSSPGYPSTYRNNSDCTWTITVPMNLHVALHFQGKTIHQLQTIWLRNCRWIISAVLHLIVQSGYCALHSVFLCCFLHSSVWYGLTGNMRIELCGNLWTERKYCTNTILWQRQSSTIQSEVQWIESAFQEWNEFCWHRMGGKFYGCPWKFHYKQFLSKCNVM